VGQKNTLGIDNLKLAKKNGKEDDSPPHDVSACIAEACAFYRRVLPDEPCDANGKPIESISVLVADSASGCDDAFVAFVTQRDKRCFIQAPSTHLSTKGREVLTDLLELADEMGCKMACVCVPSDAVNLPTFVRTYNYLGFEHVSPSEVRNNWRRRVDSCYAALAYDLQ
jgi:hypothetical protein